MSQDSERATDPHPVTPEPTQDQPPWSETRVVGQSLPRVDAYERVSGSAVYPSDVNLPGMLYGAVKRCPYAHALLKAVSTEKAAAMPGVHAVIAGKSPGGDIPWHGSGDKAQSRLFDDHCRHEGEEVAAVAAETPYQAWDAVRAIEVEYEELPHVVDEDDARADGAPVVRGESNLLGEPAVFQRGDVEAAFAEADAVVEETFSTACELHTPMESHGCVAKWDGGRLTVWESTQGVYGVQRDVARALKLPLSQVRVIGHYVGGGFGSKLWAGKWSVIAALLARESARPVKLFLTREETLIVAGNRPGNWIRVKVGAKKDGTLTAMEMKGSGSGGAYSGGGTGLLDWQLKDLYECPNVASEMQNIALHAGTQAPMRAPGHPQGSWALEQALDMLADKLQMDPVELRLKNIPELSHARGGIPYTSNGFKECLEDGAREFGWQEARGRGRDEGAVVRGVGMAGCTWVAGGGGPPSTAIVKYFSDGSVNLNLGASDIGTGTKTVMAMIVAEELSVPLEQIQVEHADTGTTQYATPSGGSKTVPTESPAVRAAALECRQQLLALAAEELEVPAEDLALEQGEVRSASDPEKRIVPGRIKGFQRTQVIVGVGYRGPNPEGKAICPFAAQFCEVEVNERTGQVRVVRFLGAHDSGRVLNRLTYDNQVAGGIVMGIGFGLTERRILDRGQTGKMVNKNFHDYKVPTALDVPGEIQSVAIDPGDQDCNTTGAKGLGEPVTIPTAAAIANAVFAATGVRVTDTPITPGRLLELLKDRDEEGRV